MSDKNKLSFTKNVSNNEFDDVCSCVCSSECEMMSE